MLWDVFLLLIGLALAAVGIVNGATAPVWWALALMCGLAAALRWQRLRLARLLVALSVKVGGPVPVPATTPSIELAPVGPSDVGGETGTADARTAQFMAWDTGKAELIRDGEALSDALRSLVLRENDDGLSKDLVASITYRRAGTWMRDVDEYEDYWFGGHSLAPGVVRRWVSSLGYHAAPAPKPVWRQQRVRDIELRLDRLRQRSAPSTQR